MGCCVSKQEKLSSSSKVPALTPESETFQEEKVKEVLSETPNPNKQLGVKSPDQLPRLLSQLQKKNIPDNNNNNSKRFPADFTQAISNNKKTNNCEDVVVKLDQEVSEVSGATTATAVTEKDSELSYGEVSMKFSSPPAKDRRKRSVSGELNTCRRGRCAAVGSGIPGANVGGRSSLSPVRRRHTSATAGVGKPTHSGRVTTNIAGERRSVSPAAKQQQQRMVGGMQQRKANGQTSPVRRAQAAGPPQPVRLPPPPSHGGKFTGEESTSGRSGGVLSGVGGGKESLENPLVSLECFIFL